MKLIKDLGMMLATENSKRKSRFGLYECSVCKKHFKSSTWDVKRNKTTQCRSCASRSNNTTHRESNTPVYNRWDGMKQRCLNPKNKGYKNYGGRGIIIYPLWINSYISYRDYILCLPNALKDGYSLDRAHNDYGYEPMNLRWVSKTVQVRNTRQIKSTNKSGYRGVHLSSADNKWKSSISISNKSVHLGYFDTAKEAAKAYDKYVLENNLEHTINNV